VARRSFLNCRKCCKSSTSSKWLWFQNFFNTATKSPHRNEIDFCGSRQTYVDNLALRACWVVQAWPKASMKCQQTNEKTSNFSNPGNTHKTPIPPYQNLKAAVPKTEVIPRFIPSGESQMVSGAHFRLLALGVTRLLSQWMVHWWQVTATTHVKLSLASIHQHRTGWTGRKCRLSSLRYDPARNRTHSTSFSGVCSTHRATSLFFIFTSKPGSIRILHVCSYQLDC